MSKSNKTTITALDQKIITALGSQLKTTATITLGGEAYKAKDLQQQLQAEVDAASTTQSAKTAWQQAVLAEDKVAAQAALLRKALRAYLIRDLRREERHCRRVRVRPEGSGRGCRDQGPCHPEARGDPCRARNDGEQAEEGDQGHRARGLVACSRVREPASSGRPCGQGITPKSAGPN